MSRKPATNARIAADNAAKPQRAGKTAGRDGLTEREDEIRRLRSLTTSMIAAIHHPLLVVDPDLRISIANDAFLEMFPGVAEGGSLEEHFNPDGLRSLVSSVAGTGRSSVDTTMSIGQACSAPAASARREFQVSALRLTGDGESPLVLITIDEMTELRLREAQLLESSRLVALGEMTASIAHELNNPLTAILGFSQLAMLSEMDDTLARDVEAIATEARRAGRIVDNLLSFSRRRKNERKAFSPVAAVQHVLDLRQYECRVNNIEVVTYFDDETPRTVGDLHQLQQVFLNLLNNAIHAISDHRGHGVITIGIVGIGEDIRISFADDGPGIPPDVLQHVFEPFYTTKPVGKGTGLGLSICRRIVEEHGGTLQVKSRAGRGATFTVEIPVLDANPGERDLDLTVESSDPAVAMLKVLVIDDEPALLDLVSRALGGSGHQVETAPDGARSLELLYTTEYDAILLDLKMPGLGGQEVYQCLQSIRPELTERVMFMSGDFASPEVKTFIETAGNPVLSKPFSVDDLRRGMNSFARAKLERTAV